MNEPKTRHRCSESQHSSALTRTDAGISRTGHLRALWFAVTAWLMAFGGTTSAWAREVHVATLIDGPAARELLPPVLLVSEAQAVLGDALTVSIPADAQLNGNWSLDGLNAALDRLESDPQVDVIVTLGFVASHLAAHRAQLAKPTIAAFAVDPPLQGYPLQSGTSGRHNFSYAASVSSIADEIGTFHRVVGFKHLAVLADRLALNAVPELQEKARQVGAMIAAEITLVPTDSVSQALAQLPPATDAVFVAPLTRLTDADIASLASALADRKLPTFSRLGRSEVDAGLLLTTSPNAERLQRLARRIALDIQRIVDGEDAANLEVAFPSEQRLAINMKTAALLGFSPHWDDLSDALQLNGVAEQNEQKISLLEALNAAVNDSPTLRSTQLGAEVAKDQSHIARAALLPNLSAGAAHTQIDASHANPLFQAERSSAVSAAAQQVLYSDRAWAGWSVAQRLQSAADELARQGLLDTLDATATAYFNTLSAQSIESVRRQNVENTRTNLQTARAREAVGLTEHSDYLRWISEMARARQELLAAEAVTRAATAELGRLIHYNSPRALKPVESGLEDPLNWIASARTQRYLDTPAKWQVLQEYVVSHALEQSPEIRRLDQLVTGQQRLVTSAQRSFYLPDLVLVANGANTLERGGAGSQRIPSSPGDTAWSVGVQATLPLFSGGLQRATLAQDQHQLRLLNAQRDATADAVGARARTVLARISASFPSIALSHEAAVAARENFSKVTDAYARGLVSVTDLISAQDAALAASLAEAQASFAYLTDLSALLRVSNNFDLLLDPQSRELWYEHMDTWFRDHGLPIAAH